ncbi:MAG: class I SAM-dependent methyltransferase [Candidatus Omnitrophota bacterium]
MKNTVTEHYKQYCQRIEFYKSFGYDVEKERNFIIEKSYPLYGDILEVGTGKGYFTLALAREGCCFTSIDISQQEQDIAKLYIKHFGFDDIVDFKIEDAQKLSFKDGEFDVVFSINACHHFNNPFKAVDELIRIISFEGKIVLSDFSKQGIELIEKIHQSEGGSHQSGKFTLGDIANYLLEKKLRVEKYRTVFQELIIADRPII